MIKVILCGALGKMGRMVAEEIAAEKDLSLAAAIEAPTNPELGCTLHGVAATADIGTALSLGDVLVDFTNPEGAVANVLAAAAAGKPAVVGTTGMKPEQLAEARKAAERIPLIISPNMSVGVNLLFSVVGEVARTLADFDAEIVEMHHNKKKDSPSGTAARLAEAIAAARPGSRLVHGREGMVGARTKEEIGVHALRGGDVVGEHTVVFAGDGERFELVHRAHSRRTFARGTIRAIRFIVGKKPGLYTMKDVLGL